MKSNSLVSKVSLKTIETRTLNPLKIKRINVPPTTHNLNDILAGTIDWLAYGTYMVYLITEVKKGRFNNEANIDLILC